MLLHLCMPYFLVLVSHVGTLQAYACAYRTSGNQDLDYMSSRFLLRDRVEPESTITHRNQERII